MRSIETWWEPTGSTWLPSSREGTDADMGRYINTALGQRWTDEPSPDDPERLVYPARTYEALGRIEGKIDALAKGLIGEGAVAAKPSSPPPASDPRMTTLAKAMGDPLYHFPTGAIPSLTFDADDEIIATGLTLEGRFWSVSDIVKLGLINERGAWLWARYSAISHALPPVTTDYLRPHFAATVAGRPSL